MFIAYSKNAASSQKRKRSESSEEATPSRSSGPASRGGQASSNRAFSIRGEFTAHSAPNPPGSNRANSTAHSYQSHQSWTPPRAEVTTRGEGRPEAEATASSEVAVTTGEDSLDEAGGGRGAAGRLLQFAANIEAAPNVILYVSKIRKSFKKKTMDVIDLFQNHFMVVVVYNIMSMYRKNH